MTDREKIERLTAALKQLDRIVKRGGSFFQDGKRIIETALADSRGDF